MQSAQRLSQGRGRPGVVDEMRGVLGCLEWNGQVKSIDGHDSVHELTTYMSRNWFSNVHENQMLECLKQALKTDDLYRDEVIVEGVFFYTYLMAAYAERDSGVYTSSKQFRRLRVIAESLASRERKQLATIINVNDNHWVSVVVDFENAVLFYADSMGAALSSEVAAVLSWWTNLHSARDFAVLQMPVTKQDGYDSYSCGLLCYNALENFFFKQQAPLVDARAADEGRLEMFLRITKRRICSVSSYSFKLCATFAHRKKIH